MTAGSVLPGWLAGNGARSGNRPRSARELTFTRIANSAMMLVANSAMMLGAGGGARATWRAARVARILPVKLANSEMADQRSLAAQFLHAAAAALRQPDSQPPTNDHEYKSKTQRVENFAVGIENLAACIAQRRHDCMANFAKVQPAPLVNSKVRETVPKKNHSLDDRLAYPQYRLPGGSVPVCQLM